VSPDKFRRARGEALGLHADGAQVREEAREMAYPVPSTDHAPAPDRATDYVDIGLTLAGGAGPMIVRPGSYSRTQVSRYEYRIEAPETQGVADSA